MEIPLRIGNVELPGRVVLAPMSGVTDAPFRTAALRFGAPVVVSEMIASEALAHDKPEMLLKAQCAGGTLHVVQLAGREARWLAEGARRLAGSGADIIDINMGCPSKRVTTGYCGASLMRDGALAGRLVEAVVAASPVPVTVKMRLGWDEQTINAAEIARIAVEAGAQAITVHGRTRQQFYKGTANWSKVRAVRDTVNVPLVVNGDISSVADAREALRQSGADAVMVGRASYGKPWLTAKIEAELGGRRAVAPSMSDLAEAIAAHYEAMLVHYGVAIGLRAARKHVGWYLSGNLPESIYGAVLPALMTSEDPQFVIRGIRAAFRDGHEQARAA
ncbi:MAG: tRNA dihydrouridine synthase DusB [Rhodobiaceae bacterium]|nr:tRNA dihydrouridine synthase DusB [Rhodobiaceae bacterium]MCC0057363.1 tRNA dihydrouridine synthase DusB [Rhodobiaceae bacterium]